MVDPIEASSLFPFGVPGLPINCSPLSNLIVESQRLDRKDGLSATIWIHALLRLAVCLGGVEEENSLSNQSVLASVISYYGSF